MNLESATAPAPLLGTDDVQTYLLQVRAGTLDTSAAFAQFGWVILSEDTAQGAGGPFNASFSIRAGTDALDFNILNPITDATAWRVVHHKQVKSLLQASNMSLLGARVLTATSALAVEKLDTIEDLGRGGRDRLYCDADSDRLILGVTSRVLRTRLEIAALDWCSDGHDICKGGPPCR